jgi:VWFA-related protein
MIPFRRPLHRVILVVLFGLALLPLVAHAQLSPTQIIVNYPELQDVDDALQLGVYFTLADNGGRVVPDARIKSVSFQLDDGSTQAAEFEQPTTPFYIVLVLDASGSMGGAAEDMRQAAIQAVNDAPEEARFAIIRFNDSVNILQEFTEDRNRAINAIGEVQPVNLAGTCLYDASYEAIRLIKDAPQGRRAIIVFTDGKDETASGDPCSRRTLQEVKDFANDRAARVPIHTIGMSTREQNINANELRDMASSTGGLSAIGDQSTLQDLFQQIMDALKSQWYAKALIYPLRGPHTAVMTVVLDDQVGTRLSALIEFEAARDYYIPPTPTFTPTPIVVEVEIQSVTANIEQELITLEVAVKGEDVISEYRFSFFDADTNQLLDRVTLPGPLTPPINIAAGNLRGDIRVELRIVDRNGDPLTWTEGREQEVDKAVYEFSFIRPTPVPTSGPATAIPVGVELNSIAYDPNTDLITLDLSLIGREQMGWFDITIQDADTNLVAKTYTNIDPAETVELKADNLTPLKDYLIFVLVQDSVGQRLGRSNEQQFTYTPPITPTPTRTPTPSPTATEKPVEAVIGSISLDESAGEIIVGILTEDESRIVSFELQLRSANTGLVIGNYVHTPPPYETIRIPLANLPPGEYAAVLRAFGEEGRLLFEAAPLNFAYAPPPTPTPTLTPTPTFTPSPTPAPGLVERVTDTVRDNPPLALVVFLIGLGLVVLLVILVRPRKKQTTGTGFLASQTGFYQMPSAPDSAAPRAPKPRSESAASPAPAPAPAAPEATAVQGFDAEATNVYADAVPPAALLVINRSPAAARLGSSIPLNSLPFKVGRGSQERNDLSLDEDTSVSRGHAVFTVEQGKFFLTDQGSSNGTFVDGVRLSPQSPTPLYNGATVVFGKGTEVTFKTTGETTMGGRGADMDPNTTDYVNIR